ncbi:hypothetical protein B4099_0750 [Heyndrickxia coagulans]|uniref:Uncharacterized protein n=1 Tax=Heyndrickxia coagulans TaxID=1398 RepID=A0A150K2Y1_HEYCO|nr:hypothetical protein B4099_0750 [Heyndrickxia coagulans]
MAYIGKKQKKDGACHLEVDTGKAGARVDFLKKEHKHVKRRNITKHYT